MDPINDEQCGERKAQKGSVTLLRKAGNQNDSIWIDFGSFDPSLVSYTLEDC